MTDEYQPELGENTSAVRFSRFIDGLVVTCQNCGCIVNALLSHKHEEKCK